MKIFIKLLKINIALIFIFLSTDLNGQLLPKEWEGKWEGKVETWGYNTKMDSFAMSIEITPKDSVWDFTIFYDRKIMGQPDIRKYQLIVVDKAKHRLAIDEKNSIFLDCFINDNCMFNKFAGMGSDLQVRMCLDETQQEMTYEITSYYDKPIRVSGNQIIQSDTIPEIKSYDLYFLMKAILKKKK